MIVSVRIAEQPLHSTSSFIGIRRNVAFFTESATNPAGFIFTFLRRFVENSNESSSRKSDDGLHLNAAMDAFQLDSTHIWKAAPGCRILVVDGGAVRIDFPAQWTVISRPKYVCVVDQYPARHQSLIAISWRRVPVDALGLPLEALLKEASSAETRTILYRRGPFAFFRPPLEGVWTELRVVDSEDGREVCSRICLARADCTQALLIFDSPPEDELTLFPVWRTVLATIAVGDYIENPTTGERRVKRG
jgi:hypothetical protein